MTKQKNEQEHKARIEMLEFQIAEIEAATLKSGEDQVLNQKRDKLLNHKNIADTLTNAYVMLDDEEFSSKKDVYVNLTYAELYMAQTRYEEALSLYEQLLSQSAEEELGLEEVIYQQMCKIYQERNDFENYKKI